MDRFQFLAGALLAAVSGRMNPPFGGGADMTTQTEPGSPPDDSNPEGETQQPYGLIGKIVAQSGHRDELIEILLEGTRDMPGCLSYVVARDAEDPNAIWITEVWADRERHAASLELPAVQEAMAQGRPLIAGFEEGIETEPVGGWNRG